MARVYRLRITRLIVEKTLARDRNVRLKELAEIWPELSEKGQEEVARWCDAVACEIPEERRFGPAAALELLWVKMRLEDGRVRRMLRNEY